MGSRSKRLLALGVLTAGLVVPPVAAASADDEPDTTAPQVRLNPCYAEETSCRRVRAQVFGDLEPGDDLAVLGARIGDVVVAETVYDDGTGFEPHGSFRVYGGDVEFPVDYALSVEVPRGTSEITFYARDLEGNTSELATTVRGTVPPGPVRRLTAELTGARKARVSWRPPNLKGSCCAQHVVTTPGHRPKRKRTVPPSYGALRVIYRDLTPGWHRFTVRSTTEGGTGPKRRVRLFVPRRPRH